MENIKYINSVSEFLAWVEDTRPVDINNEYALFYRGHSDKNYELKPTVYRVDNKGKSFRTVEHQLYEEMLRLSPTAFNEDKSMFERLVRMQHHGLPTRLLDLTYSPLIALYFACNSNASKPKAARKKAEEDVCFEEEKTGKDGEVIFYPRKRTDVLHPSDIPETALTGIDRNVDFSHIANQVMTLLVSYLKESQSWPLGEIELNQHFNLLINKCSEASNVMKDNTDLFEISAALQFIESEVKKFAEEWDQTLNEKKANANSSEVALAIANTHLALQKYRKQHEEDISGLIATICENLGLSRNIEKRSLSSFFNQFTRYYFVYPSINNERIRRQQGAFLIAPPARTIHWEIHHIQPIVHRVRISADAKTQILKELSYLGITHSYVYPDLTAAATDAKSWYPATTETPINSKIVSIV